MIAVQRFLRVLAGLVLFLATCAAAISFYAPPPSFTPYVDPAPPQRAEGDFDGDGRVDTAFIKDRAGASRISIQLTSSSSSLDLGPAVTSVVEGDIDHDGDLDLVAATPSGELLVWINDGRGHFTRQVAAYTSAISSEPVLVRTVADQPFAVNVRVASLPSSGATAARLVRTTIRPRRVRQAICALNVALPLLRAPPAQSL
jgi:hypothetical protein